nr:uncharacterized protein LOC117603389 [Osmia lignaria]
MGNIPYRLLMHLRVRKDHDAISPVDYKDFETMKRIWQVIETDSSYYGFAFCTVIFKNHPQYAKYFEDESIPEFIQEAKVKKKFSIICDMLCALFVDYHDNPSQREYLLGYIAMVHKNMGLTLKDLENFLGDLMETLVMELPNVMTEECVSVQTKYFHNLTNILLIRMDEHEKRFTKMLNSSDTIKKCCTWCTGNEPRVIYGFPLKYWLYKKRYWEYRKAVWVAVEADMLRDFQKGSAGHRFKRLFFDHKTTETRKVHRKRRTVLASNSSESDIIVGRKESFGQMSRKSSEDRSRRISNSPYKAEKDPFRSSELEFDQDVTYNDNTENMRIVAAVVPSKVEINRKDEDMETLSSLIASGSDLKSQKATSNHTARERKRIRNSIIRLN